ncbi:type I-E CRISPR-associated protein Cse1/CasA [Paracoccus jiaweipingae]|uniref:type I-E CRISPR-associated protein Cse1/CasA n=1 Tax=unclassified Paracoccus (in: a-proteobacteria) TaxID=2688777 RepID=UPI0037A12923
MSLNLISDPWIPVIDGDGAARVIAPWQIADDTIARLDWPRADLNIACLELLIGLVFLADPPLGPEDWSARRAPDPDRLRDRLSAFAPAFDLLGDGPRFMQDRAVLEGQPNPPDMLFIDSAGGNTIKNNADLMVWRGRYGVLQPAMAAMALYTLQAFAPSGGAGNRTSMRGGGPMVTLVQPEGGLWPLIWANVPDGAAADAAVLPWMRPTVTSEKGGQVFPQQAHPAEAFFGMPRRLRLVCDDGVVTGVIQRPYGTNYAGWDHPLTPFYRVKPGAEWLPKHPRAGVFGYRHWLGVVIGGDSDLTRRAQTVRDWHLRSRGQGARVLVAGWAMDNMKPRDFILSVPPLLPLDPDAEDAVTGMIQAADLLSLALRSALMPVLAEGEAREALREAFYMHTQAAFEARLAALSAGTPAGDVARGWLTDMRGVAMNLFETRALSGLADRTAGDQKAVVDAHRHLASAFAGYGGYGAKAYTAMSLEQPPKKGKSS